MQLVRKPLSLLFLTGCLLAACAPPVDLSAVKAYASTTASASDSFSALASGFEATCQRYNAAENDLVTSSSKTYQPPTIIGDPTPQQLQSAASIASRLDIAPGYHYTPSSTATSAPATGAANVAGPVALKNDSTCTDAATVSTGWDLANSTVLAYVQSLGALAGVDAIPTPDTSGLGTALTKVGVSPDAISAGSDLLNVIVTFFRQQQAQRDIARYLGEVNPHMAGAMQALEVVDAAYAIQLQDEYTAVATQYGAFARSQLHQYGAITGRDEQSVTRRSNIANRLLKARSVVLGDLDYINAQRAATLAYGSAIEQILATHEQLYEASRRKATFRDYVSIIQTTGAPALVDLENLAKAVKT